ncbi:MAG: glycosyltransferase [Deltaproteobacteria bacterium]|jgi:spore maturation protein CgeB|nr:glycosyltransferase [Deltaproteobacteria bacterium]
MRAWFDSNLALLRERDPSLASLVEAWDPARAGNDGPAGRAAAAAPVIIFPPKEPPSLPEAWRGARLPLDAEVALEQCEEGPVLSLRAPVAARLTSRASEREDKALAERFLREAGDSALGGVTALGLGLGWHIERVSGKIAGAPLWIFEAAPQIWAAAFRARDLGAILRRPETRFFCGACAPLPRGAPAAVMARPAALKFFPGMYPEPARGSPPGKAAPRAAGAAAEALPSLAANSKGGALAAGAANSKDNALAAVAANFEDETLAAGASGEGAPAGAEEPEARPPLLLPDLSGNARPAPSRSPLRPRVLFFRSGYFLDREIRSAVARLSWPCALWEISDFRDAEKDREKDFKRLLGTIRDFRPDFVLTVNHLGFDEGGLLAGILARLGIPAATWFVDSPWFILKGAELGAWSDLWAFAWDSDYLAPLRELGFPGAAYLPLAADEALLEAGARGPGEGPYARDIAFVGDSLEAATEKYLALARAPRAILPETDALAAAFLESPGFLPDLAALTAGGPLSPPGRPRLSEFLECPAARLALEALVTWRASRIARVRLLSAMPPGLLTVAGDPGWQGLLGDGVSLPGAVAGQGALGDFYRSSRVNLNVTSAQMKTGMNQRVFDAPAAGGFLLTDRRAQLEGLFEASELCVYSEPAEARDLALWHLARPDARRRLAERTRRAVAERHLYRHRLPELARTVLGRAAA